LLLCLFCLGPRPRPRPAAGGLFIRRAQVSCPTWTSDRTSPHHLNSEKDTVRNDMGERLAKAEEELAEVKKQTELDTSFSPTHLATMRQELDHLRSGYSEVRR